MNSKSKILYSIGLLCCFSACVPIRVVPGYNPDLYNGYKVIQAYQKQDTIGHTDPEQRKKDVFSCGVINYREGDLDLSESRYILTMQQTIERRETIENCMESKGYIIHSSMNCTRKGKPTGFCN